MKTLKEHINLAIKENELEANDWALNDLAWELYWWADLFNTAFFMKQPVPVPAISFEKTRVTMLGHYVIGRNAFGLKENINLNRAHLSRPLWEILATLLHEMTHSWQANHGKPSNSWFHNKEFRDKLLSFGVLSDQKGCHITVGDPFVFLLKKHGVIFDQNDGPGGLIVPPKEKPKGKSKLKKWQCSCGQRARVGKKEFFATCDLCHQGFEPAD
ncbi:hypothetical protein C4588_03340 [Candidatus Parcubacteria bacterium]|nr:MAG: hypothetical protein C4588_03340 [Candidatus Parcubacteria bacterium]